VLKRRPFAAVSSWHYFRPMLFNSGRAGRVFIRDYLIAVTLWGLRSFIAGIHPKNRLI
jgi:hypothetical protein